MTQREKILELMIAKNPSMGAYKGVISIVLAQVLKEIGVVNGETPVKGKDYFTDAEKNAWISMIANEVYANIQMKLPKDGHTPTSSELKDLIIPLIPRVKDGSTPVKGKDYLTDKELNVIKTQIRQEVQKEIMQEISQTLNSVPTVDDILTGVKKEYQPVNTKDVVNEILSNPYLRLLLRGGGSSSSVAPSALNTEVPVGAVNDANTSFTVSNTPVFINVNGAIYTAGTGIFTSYGGGTITLSSPVGLGGFIRSYY